MFTFSFVLVPFKRLAALVGQIDNGGMMHRAFRRAPPRAWRHRHQLPFKLCAVDDTHAHMGWIPNSYHQGVVQQCRSSVLHRDRTSLAIDRVYLSSENPILLLVTLSGTCRARWKTFKVDRRRVRDASYRVHGKRVNNPLTIERSRFRLLSF